MAKYNENRIISLDKEGVVYKNSVNQSSWRYNIKYLLDMFTDNSNLLSSSKLEDYVVDSDVCLLMSDKFPAINSMVALEKNELIDKILGNNKFTKVANIATQVISGVSDTIADWEVDNTSSKTLKNFAPWIKNMKFWSTSATTPISFSYTFKFNLGQYGLWNAKKEVFLPIMNLVVPTFLQELNSLTMRGPFPTELGIVKNFLADTIKDISNWNNSDYDNTTKSSLSSMWDGIKSTWTDGSWSENNFLSRLTDSVEAVASVLESIVLDSYSGYIYTVKFGNFITFKHMMITSSKFEFGNEVDQYGYPISGNVTLTFEGMMPPSLTTSENNSTVDRLAVTIGG